MRYKLTYHTHFNFELGYEEGWYYLWVYAKTFYGRRKWKKVREYNAIGVKLPVAGDNAWARRVAEHLGISLPDSQEIF